MAGHVFNQQATFYFHRFVLSVCLPHFTWRQRMGELMTAIGEQEILCLPIEKFAETSYGPLTSSVVNSLHNANIFCVGQLVQKTEGELRELSRIGNSTVRKIKRMLADNGLHLAERHYLPTSFSPVSQTLPELHAEMTYVFRQAGYENVQWPIPDTVQKDLSRRLRLARAHDEYSQG